MCACVLGECVCVYVHVCVCIRERWVCMCIHVHGECVCVYMCIDEREIGMYVSICTW